MRHKHKMESKKIDIRTRPTDLQVRDTQDGAMKISGYAIVFNEISQDMGFYEYIQPTALHGLDLSDLLLLYNHDYSNILARASSDNLHIKIDKKGLFFSATLPETTLGRDTYNNILAGNLKGCSFSFTLPQDGSGDTWDRDKSGNLIHYVTQIDEMSEISITSVPAYNTTSVRVQRSLDKLKKGATNLAQDEQKPSMDLEALINKLVEALTESKPEPKAQSKDDKDKEAKPAEKEPAETGEGEAEEVEPEGAQEVPGETEEPEPENPEDDKDKKDRDSKGQPGVVEVPLAGAKKKKKKKRADEDKELDEETPDTEVQADTEVPSDGDADVDLEDPEKDIRSMKGNENMSTVLKSKKDEQLRSFEEYMKSKGQVRDGLVEEDGKAVIPEDILKAYTIPNDPNNLAQYVNKIEVSAPAGRLPMLSHDTDVLVDVEELAQNPEMSKPGIGQVDYKLATKAGVLPVSFEMVQDAVINIPQLVSEHAQYKKERTEQVLIGKALQEATPVEAHNADDLKDAFNHDLGNYTKMFVMSESAYAEVDKIKDDNGRYLFQESLTAPSGKQLFGAPVAVVGDDVLGKAGEAHMFIGDVKAFVLEAHKGDMTIKWDDNDIRGSKALIYTRIDVEVADAKAGKFVTFKAQEDPKA